MAVQIIVEENTILALLSGEIDHHTARGTRTEIDSAIDSKQPAKLILDFAGVSFMDSSGIGLVMGRYKIMQSIGGSIHIQNPPSHIKRVMQVAGLDKLASISYVKEG